MMEKQEICTMKYINDVNYDELESSQLTLWQQVEAQIKVNARLMKKLIHFPELWPNAIYTSMDEELPYEYENPIVVENRTKNWKVDLADRKEILWNMMPSCMQLSVGLSSKKVWHTLRKFENTHYVKCDTKSSYNTKLKFIGMVINHLISTRIVYWEYKLANGGYEKLPIDLSAELELALRLGALNVYATLDDRQCRVSFGGSGMQILSNSSIITNCLSSMKFEGSTNVISIRRKHALR